MFVHEEVSKHVSFYRRHQRIPNFEEVEAAYEKATDGDIKGAIELLNWKRHCFFAKTNYEAMVMNKVFEFYKKIAE